MFSFLGLRHGMHFAQPINNWLLIYPDREYNNVRNFMKEFKMVSHGLKFNYREPRHVVLKDTRIPTYIHHLREQCKTSPHFVRYLGTYVLEQFYLHIFFL